MAYSFLPIWLFSCILLQNAPAFVAGLTDVKSDPPTVTIKNGTIRGSRLSTFKQDAFLGVPFAQPPIDNLRLRHPHPLITQWNGIYDATQRSPSCPGYGGFDSGLTMGEDCLTLDIVRPSEVKPGENLPVLVWIYGGGFTAGGSADPQYNTSYLVNASVTINKPIITVSVNYRVGGWGFLGSKETEAAGTLNIGLFDQRMALQWINENIAAFGGDPHKVTISGESAGAFSVGYHLVGFDGDNSQLFRAAIMQSGTSMARSILTIGQLDNTYQTYYDNITQSVGCADRADSLDCLRQVPYEALYQAFAPFVMSPVIDGYFLKRLPSESFKQGRVANVAILTGSNTDEGTATFFGPRGTLYTDNDVRELINSLATDGTFENTTVDDLLALYPDNPAEGCPFETGEERFAQHGYMYKRGAAIIGDAVIHAGRRATTMYFSAIRGQKQRPVYSYRFDQSPWNGIEQLIATEPPVYATHYVEVPFVFNIDPAVSQNNTNWIGPGQDFYQLSTLMARSWLSFVHDLDPNHHGISGVPHWPDYAYNRKNFVFKIDSSYVESDNWRQKQLGYWGEIFAQLGT